jgi:hypothetical protein
MGMLKPVWYTPLNKSRPLSKGLNGLWLFNDTPQIGGAAFDLTGNNLIGTMTNGAVSVPGEYGNVIDFDGSDDYITVPVNPLTAPPNVTVIVRNMRQQAMGGTVILIDNGREQQSKGFQIRGDGGNLQMIVSSTTGNNAVTVSAGTYWPEDTWTDLAFTWDGITNRGYSNGIQVGTASGNPGDVDPPSVALGFGARGQGSNALNCKIDFVMIYRRVLLADELKSLHDDPFEILKRDRTSIWMPSSPGGVTVTPSTLSLAASLNAPETSVTSTPSTLSLAASLNAPETSVTSTPSTLSLATSLNAPTLSIGVTSTPSNS